MHRVLRWDVPVDDQWHEIGAGYVAHVAARTHRELPGDLVEVWTVEDTPGISVADLPMRSVTIVGTGHVAPDNAEHIGSAVVPAFHIVSGPTRGTVEHIESTTGLVWHVFAKYDPAEERQRLAEEGRRLASIREDLIASGVDPTELPAPLFPDPLPEDTDPRSQVERVRDVLRMPIYQRGSDTNPMVTIEAILWALDGAADVSSYVTGDQVGARTPTALGNEVHGTVRSAQVHTLEDEATGLAYWIAHELGEHVDDLDGETLTQSVRRLLAVKLAPPDADAVPITDWGTDRAQLVQPGLAELYGVKVSRAICPACPAGRPDFHLPPELDLLGLIGQPPAA